MKFMTSMDIRMFSWTFIREVEEESFFVRDTYIPVERHVKFLQADSAN